MLTKLSLYALLKLFSSILYYNFQIFCNNPRVGSRSQVPVPVWIRTNSDSEPVRFLPVPVRIHLFLSICFLTFNQRTKRIPASFRISSFHLRQSRTFKPAKAKMSRLWLRNTAYESGAASQNNNTCYDLLWLWRYHPHRPRPSPPNLPFWSGGFLTETSWVWPSHQENWRNHSELYHCL